MSHPSILLLVASMGLSTTCGKPEQASPVAPVAEATRTPLSEQELKWVKHCVKVLEATVDEPADEHLIALVVGCGVAAKTQDVVDTEVEERNAFLVEHVGLACNPEVAKSYLQVPPAQLAPFWIKECGPTYYGLSEKNAEHMSNAWFVGQRAGAWIADVRRRAQGEHDELVKQFDQVFATFAVQLPLSLHGKVAHDLPTSKHFEDTRSKSFVLIGAESVQVTAMPALRLAAEGAILTDALASAKKISISALPQTLAVGEGTMLLVAQAGQKASRVLEVAHQLDAGYFATRLTTTGINYSDHAIRSPVALSNTKPRKVAATLWLGDKGIRVGTGGAAQQIAWSSDRYDVEALHHLLKAARSVPDGEVLIGAEGAVTYQDLIAVLDVMGELRFPHVGTLPPVETSKLKVEGGLQQAAVEAVVAKKLPRIQHCYSKELLSEPALEGVIVASFQVDTAGKVADLKLTGLSKPQLQKCAEHALGALRFPTSKTDTTVRYPLHFELPAAN